MLSRISRMSSLGTQFIGGCSLWRDAPIAPKVVPPVVGEHHFYHDHASYCKTVFRQRSSNSGSDPFLGIGKEPDQLNDLFDLDSWKASETLLVEDGVGSVDMLKEVKIEDDLPWMERFGPIDFNAADLDNLHLSSMSDHIIEKADAVDWQAWENYLGDDSESLTHLKLEGDDVAAHQSPFDMDSSDFGDSSISESFDVPDIKIENEVDFEDASSKSSYSSSKRRLRCSESPSTFVSYGRYPVKKRGVKLKPREDDVTDRRRAMNREAALRYRERKRYEQHKFLSLHNSLDRRNRELKDKERKLRAEISRLRTKMCL